MIEFARQNYLPAWKLFGGTRLLWYARFEALRDAEIKKQFKRIAELKAKELIE